MALALSSGQVRPSHEYRKWAVLTFDQMDIITLLGQAKYFFNCFAGAISGTGSDSYMSTWPIYIETVNKWSHCSTLLFIFYYLAGKLTSCGVLFASVYYPLWCPTLFSFPESSFRSPGTPGRCPPQQKGSSPVECKHANMKRKRWSVCTDSFSGHVWLVAISPVIMDFPKKHIPEIKKVASNKGLHYIHAVATGCYSLGLLLKFEVNEQSSINLPWFCHWSSCPLHPHQTLSEDKHRSHWLAALP